MSNLGIGNKGKRKPTGKTARGRGSRDGRGSARGRGRGRWKGQQRWWQRSWSRKIKSKKTSDDEEHPGGRRRSQGKTNK